MSKMRALDRIDRKLLNLLQIDNLTPTRVLAELTHISQPTCLRRLRDLRDDGVIAADISRIDTFALGLGMLAFLEVSLTNQAEEKMREFEQRMVKETEVMQCFFVSGEYDYFVAVHVADMEGYYQFVRRAISGSGNVRHFQSRFPMKCVKFTTQVQFDEKSPEVSVRV